MMNTPKPATPPFTAPIVRLAERIAENGFEWRTDGNDVFRLADLLALHTVETLDPAADYDGFALVRDQLRGNLHALAALYKWDHRFQTATQEGMMLDAFLSLWLRYRGVDRTFAEEHLPPRPTR